MSHPRLVPKLVLSAVVVCLFAAHAFAGCNVLVVSSILPTDPNGSAGNTAITASTAGTPANLNREGLVERVSDVLIFDDTAVAGGNCFVVGNSLRLTYNAALTRPQSIQSATAANFDVFDSNGAAGLVIDAVSQAGLAPGGTAQTVIVITVQQAGTAATIAGGLTASGAGAAVRVKNLRVDATPFSDGANVVSTVSAFQNMPAPVNAVVGVARSTIAPGAGVIQAGFGTQSSNSTLTTPAIFGFAENFGNAFRVRGNNVSGVFNDDPTNATSLIFDVGTTLPWGVTMTFPSTIDTSAAAGLGGITFRLRLGGNCTGPANCFAIYDTIANGPTPSSVTITTAAAPNTGADGNLPAIGVFIPSPSGFGTVAMNVSFGPVSSGGSNDDVQPGAVPRYQGSGVSRRVLTTTNLFLNGGLPPGPALLPNLISISPGVAVAGANGLTLTLTGTNFSPGAVVQWNGSPRATAFIGSTVLQATLLSSDLAIAGTAAVSVASPAGTSNPLNFSIAASPQPNSPLTYVLPHIVSGGGFATRVTVVNITDAPNSVVVNYLSQAGVLLESNTYNVAAGGTLRLSTPEAERNGPNTVKWAIIGSQSAVLPNAFFELMPAGSGAPVNTVGFNAAPPLSDFSVPVEFEPAGPGHTIGRTMGFALANPNNSGISVTLKLVDSTGAVLASHVVNLSAFGQAALDLAQLSEFAAALPAGNFVGSLTVASPLPVSAIALFDDFGPFSATPVGAGRAR